MLFVRAEGFNAVELLPFIVFAILPAGLVVWSWFSLMRPQRLVVAMIVTILVNLYFGFLLLPAFTVPAPGFHPKPLLVSCIPVIWSFLLILNCRNRDERLTGYVGITGVIWPLMAIDYIY